MGGGCEGGPGEGGGDTAFTITVRGSEHFVKIIGGAGQFV